MKVLAGISLAALGVLAVATPAAAQIQSAGLTPATSIFADSTAPRAPRQGDTPIDLRGQFGGVFCCGESGFLVGGGIGARPFNNKQVEIAADASFVRADGSNGLYISGNGLYHFKTSEPNFSPFAGAGLAIIHFADDTQARFQIAGGVDLNKSGKYPFRGEVRFVFTEFDTTTVLLVSVQLGKR